MCPRSAGAHEFAECLLRVDRVAAQSRLREAVAGGAVVDSIGELVTPALGIIGACWSEGRCSLAQLYMAGRIAEELVDEVLPPADPLRVDQPRMAIAVLEDHHSLGKRIVRAGIRASGFEIADYGHGVGVDELVARVRADGVRYFLTSALMLPSALRVRAVVDALAAGGPPVKVLVGGAPFRLDSQLWVEVGADVVGADAMEAVGITRSLIGEVS